MIKSYGKVTTASVMKGSMRCCACRIEQNRRSDRKTNVGMSDLFLTKSLRARGTWRHRRLIPCVYEDQGNVASRSYSEHAV